MRKFVANENISRFRHQLEKGVDGATRATLLNLLLAEERGLGHDRAQLTRVQRHIERLQGVIGNQAKLIDNLDADGHGTAREARVLDTLRELLKTHEQHREWLMSMLAISMEGGPAR